MKADGAKRVLFPFDPIFEKTGYKFRILPAPACKFMIESVHCFHILFEKPHIAPPDPRHFSIPGTGEKRNPDNMMGIGNGSKKRLADQSGKGGRVSEIKS